MGALDRLSNFSAKSAVKNNDGVFDIKTPSGAFFDRVHRAGYKMYEPCYRLKQEFLVDESSLSGDDLEAYLASKEVSQEAYDVFNDEFRAMYEKSFRYTELHDVLEVDGNQIVNAVAGSGKALVNGTKVLTDTGYRPIETLRVGDLVFGEDGRLHEVQGVFPQGFKTVYIVEFSDGNKICCSGDHLWEIKDLYERANAPRQVLSTEDILSYVHLRKPDGGFCCLLPNVPAIEFTNPQKVPVNPYLMGYLLMTMENSGSHVTFACDEGSIKNRIDALLKKDYPYARFSECYNDGLERYMEIESLDLQNELRRLKVLSAPKYKRFIPRAYLFAGRSDRLDLLRGIIDGANDSGVDAITVPSDSLCDDIQFLCEGLGFVVEKQSGAQDYKLYLQPSRYAEILHRYGTFEDVCNDISYGAKRFITHIEKMNYEQECTCISVDSPRHLYLTEHCIPTHNTTMLVFKVLHDIVTGRCMTLRALDNGMQVRAANKVWICTFLKSGAAELESALTNWQYKLGYAQTASMLTFSTMDAEFKRCLNAMGVATPLDEGGKLYNCMVKAIDSCNIKRTGYPLSKEDYNIISGIITYYRGRLDDKRYAHPACKEYELTPTILDLVVKQFAALRQQAGIMDFSEIMEFLYKYLYVTPNPQVQEFVANRYNFIYIDEFQDTSQMAYAILKFYARGKLWMNRGSGAVVGDGVSTGLYTGHETIGKLVVVGDTAQCVLPGMKVRKTDGVEVGVDVVKSGDVIQVVTGEDRYDYLPVKDAIRNLYSGEVYQISLSNGDIIRVTEDHKLFVKPSVPSEANMELCMFGGQDNKSYITSAFLAGTETVLSDNIEFLEASMDWGVKRLRENGVNVTVKRSAVLHAGEHFDVMSARDVTFGDVMCVYNPKLAVLEPAAVLGVTHQHYEGPVYDFNVDGVHNFVASNVVVHNCIYSFRGSDSTILAKQVAEDFNPTISALSVNWRCPSNILDPVVPSIHLNWDSANQVIKSAHTGGELNAYLFKNYGQMIAQLKRDIDKDLSDGMNVAILCRTNFDGMIPAVVLEQDNRFNFSISGDNMTMDSPLPRKMIGMTALFTERSTPAVKAALMEFAGRSGAYDVADLIKTLKLNNESIWDVPDKDIAHSCPALLDLVKTVKPFLFENGRRTKAHEMDALQVVYFMLSTQVYVGDSAYCEAARSYLEVLQFIIENGNFGSIYEFIEEIDYLNERLKGRVKKSNANVRIATVHEFKGKESDSVYVWNDNDGVFPYSKCNMGVEAEVNEERRVHYIACTRARKREYLYSIAGRVGMFAKEMTVKFTNPVPVETKLTKKSVPLPED